MLLIYSICRSHARHQISFPSVFLQGGGDWTIHYGGADLKIGGDYLVFGEVKTLGGTPFLALEKAVPVENTAYFTRIHGQSTEEGNLEGGLRVSSGGEFSGELVAVDQSFLVVAGVENKQAPSPASASGSEETIKPSPVSQKREASSKDGEDDKFREPREKEGKAVEVTKTEVKPETAPNETSAKREKSPVTSPDETIDSKKVALVDDNRKSNTQLGQASVANTGRPTSETNNTSPISKGVERSPNGTEGGAGEGVLIPGTIISVLSKPEEAFPESGSIPELAGVKRSELARKADARKKVVGVVAKVEKTVPSVSSSGIKLGKELGGDKKSPVVQNSIDEDELW